MGVATVANVALILRVALIGGILLLLPRVTRKGLLFGVYVGEEFTAGDGRRVLLRRWNRGCAAVMAAALVVGLTISVAGWPVTGNFTGTAVLLLAALGLYLRMHSETRALVPAGASRQAVRAAAPLHGGTPKGTVFARITLGVCLLMGFATVAYALAAYQAMPDRIPDLSGILGSTGGSSDKSIWRVMFFPLLNLVVSPFYGLLAVLMSGAKLSVREGPGGRSAEAQEAFRAANARLFSGLALLICALLSLISVQLTRFRLSQIASLGVAIGMGAGIMLVFAIGGLIVLLRRYGQGGALMEESSTDSPLAGGLADNTRWVWGMFYFDRHDPSIMVEKRFGIGYTLNYGNSSAILIVGTFLALAVVLTALGIIGIVY